MATNPSFELILNGRFCNMYRAHWTPRIVCKCTPTIFGTRTDISLDANVFDPSGDYFQWFNDFRQTGTPLVATVYRMGDPLPDRHPGQEQELVLIREERVEISSLSMSNEYTSVVFSRPQTKKTRICASLKDALKALAARFK